jgi:hypothetical protein
LLFGNDQVLRIDIGLRKTCPAAHD